MDDFSITDSMGKSKGEITMADNYVNIRVKNMEPAQFDENVSNAMAMHIGMSMRVAIDLKFDALPVGDFSSFYGRLYNLCNQFGAAPVVKIKGVLDEEIETRQLMLFPPTPLRQSKPTLLDDAVTNLADHAKAMGADITILQDEKEIRFPGASEDGA